MFSAVRFTHAIRVVCSHRIRVWVGYRAAVGMTALGKFPTHARN